MSINCPFCQIINKASLQRKRVFYEDDNFLAMLVNRPATKGHFIVFPKKHIEDIQQLDSKIGTLTETSVKLASFVISKLEARAFTLKLNHKVFLLEVGSAHVRHVHLHVIPRYKKNENLDKIPLKATPSDLQQVKDTIQSNHGQN